MRTRALQFAARDEQGGARPHRAWGVLLAVLVLCTALLRESGLGFHLPASSIVDERVYIEHLETFQTVGENPAAMPKAGFYPYLVSRVALATWRWAHGPNLQPTALSEDVAAHLKAASLLQLHVRRVVAWLSLLVIPGMWFLVRSWRGSAGSRPVALAASALCASSLLLQIYSQEGRPHGAFLGVALFAVVLAARLVDRPTFAWTLAAGALAGLGATILQTGFFLLAPIGVAIFLARGISGRRRIELATVAALPFGLAFAWGYPFLFVGQERDGAHEGHALLGAGQFGPEQLSLRGITVLADALWTYEPVLCVVIVVGGLWSGWSAWRTRRRSQPTPAAAVKANPAAADRRRLIVLASFPTTYLLVFGAYEFTWPRYSTVLVPFVAWAAAWLLVPKESRARRPLAWLLFAVVLSIQAALVLQLARVRSHADTPTQAARWIEQHLPPSARLATLASEDLPLLRNPAERQWLAEHPAPPSQPWLRYQARLGEGPWDASARSLFGLVSWRASDVAEELERNAVEYVVVQRPGNPLRRDRLRMHDALTRDATCLAVFHPTDDEDDARPFDIRDQMDEFPREGFWVGRLVRASCTGATVEVWKRAQGH